MAGKDRYAHAGTGDAQFRNAQNLAGLVAQLLLLVGLLGAVVDEVARERQRVVRDGRDVGAKLLRGEHGAVVGELDVAVTNFGHLLGQCLHAGQSGTGDCLVGRDVQALQPGGIVKHLEHRHGGHGRAVRVRDNPLRRVLRLLRVDLRDDERDLGILAERRGVIDDGGAGGREDRGPLLRSAAACGKQRDVDIGDGLLSDLGEVLDDDGLAAELKLLARRARGGEEADLVCREVTLFENGTHDAADLAGGAYNCDGGH